jgi:acetyltransferase
MDPPTVNQQFMLTDGSMIFVRTAQPRDADAMQAFVCGLSKRSSYLRFFSPLDHLPPSVLKRFTEVDYPSNMSIVANHEGSPEIIGLAGWTPSHVEFGDDECAVAVADEWQSRGVATMLFSVLYGQAKAAHKRRLEGFVLRENVRMFAFARNLGVLLDKNYQDPAVVKMYRDIA